MTDIISITGLVATTPRHLVTAEGKAITSFRLASSQRRFDIAANRWVDGDTNWYTVSAFDSLAENAAVSICKGDRVTVTGQVRIREYGDRVSYEGVYVELEAAVIGHDLNWCTSSAVRVSRPVPEAN